MLESGKKEQIFEENAQKLVRFVIKGHLDTVKYFGSYEDMEQHLLGKVWEALSKYDSARGKISTFILKVCTNEIKMIARKHNTQMRKAELVSLNDKLPSGTVIEDCIECEIDIAAEVAKQALIARIIKKLDCETYAYYIDGLTQKEIARIVGFSQSYVARKIKRNINRIRAEFMGEREI
ncbi:sigma-70 family RNA polymerase sigma factor [bacterium]|nr:sigma-70 family RNA polymerase sigma factor [bacterium]MBR2387100.1 sigma-70 family RNA polymerase sigma factor [bacterium]